MKRQILVPLDGSPLAEAILPHAEAMARLTSSEVTLLQAVPAPMLMGAMAGTPSIPYDPPTVTWKTWEDELAEARAYLAAIAKRLQSEDITVRTEVADVSPESAIVSYTGPNPNVVMIAMATHGRSGLGRWVFGSVAEKVLHAATKPLLLVRPEEKEPVETHGVETHGHAFLPAAEYHTILVPLDGSSFAEQSLGWAQALALKTGATLLLVTVASRQDAHGSSREWPQAGADQISLYLEDVARRLRAEGMSVQTRQVSGRAAEMILQTGSKAHADLIVMSSHGRGGLQRLWLGGTAMKVVRGSPTPVLLVRAKGAR